MDEPEVGDVVRWVGPDYPGYLLWGTLVEKHALYWTAHLGAGSHMQNGASLEGYPWVGIRTDWVKWEWRTDAEAI